MLAPWPTTSQPDMHHQLDDAIAKAWMAFQPILTSDGRVYGYEALLRSDAAFARSPLEILSLAAQLDRAHDVGRVARRLAAGSAPAGGHLFVNVGADELLDPVLGSVDCPLRRIADRVVLEITEQQPVAAIPHLQERLLGLRSLGFRIALDDFGAGHATVASWKVVRPDVLKVDRSIVGRLPGCALARSILEGAVALAHRAGGVVVAEGIETEAQRATVVAVGCDLLQGYLLGRPVAPDQLPEDPPRYRPRPILVG